MGNSLRDELLRAGLVTKEQAERSQRSARRSDKRGRKRRKARAPETSREEPAKSTPGRHGLRVNQQRAAKFARDPSLAGNAKPDAERKALRERIRKLVDTHRLNDADAEVPFNFLRGKRIKRLYVTAEQRERLLNDELVIAGVEGNHHLLPAGVVGELLELAPSTFVHRAGGEPDDPGADESDRGEHPVPDDLTW